MNSIIWLGILVAAIASVAWWVSGWDARPLSEEDLKDWEDEHGEGL